ncbi:VOC family protein [Pseudalkalibacillus sp. Hm43]|uniref:VOC family protein n=1 Tax=Pseudalkalibacillus sp. Hm43 TaxID=3450742 RepID=UPI003F433D25
MNHKKKKGLIHHIELYVSDLQKSLDFWDWLLSELGYSEYQKWEQGKSYKLSDSYLVFVQTEKKYMDVPYHRCRVGLNHLAFHAESREHVDQLTKALKKKGIEILYEDRHPYAGGINYYAVYFEDPDRIKVEIVAPQ